MLEFIHAYESDVQQEQYEYFVPLTSSTSHDLILNFFKVLTRYNLGVDVPSNIQEALNLMIAHEDNFIAPGGLIARENTFILFPGCCCGLEAWREWGQLHQGANSPWLGHDPDPWIDISNEIPILHNGNSAAPKQLKTTYEDIKSAFEKSEKELEAFTKNFESYLRRQELGKVDVFIRKFRNSFYVDTKAVQHGVEILSEATAKLKALGIKFPE